MKKFSSLLLLVCAMFFVQDCFAQKVDKKKNKDKKKSEQVDTTSTKVANPSPPSPPSGGGAADITIDEPGNTRGKTQNNANNKSGDTTLNKGTTPKKDVEQPKDEVNTPTEQPKEVTANEAEVGSPAEEPQKSSEAAPEQPDGAGGLNANDAGTSLTIDEAGTQKAKKPGDALNNKIDVNPTSLTIDEAGTQKAKKAIEAPSLAPSADSLKQKVGGKVLDLIRPK